MTSVDSLDVSTLASYLAANVADFKGPIRAKKFPGGQSNPTFLIEASSGRYVLRRQPPGRLLKSAHAIDREYRVLSALADTDVPVAKVYHLCEDRNVVGSMFYLMEYCDGIVHWDPSLANIENNELRAHIYGELGRVLATIHSVGIDAVGLSDFGKPGNYFQRQYDRWSKQYRNSEMGAIAEMDQLIAWLGERIPEDDGRVSLVHGDYRLDNLMFSRDNHNVIAVLDWELSTLGHPFADLAYQCMSMRLPADDSPNMLSGLQDVDIEALGIPSEEEFVASYCEHMELAEIPNWDLFIAFSFFRTAAIAQGVGKRAAEGNASSPIGHRIGAMVRPLARMALESVSWPGGTLQ